MNNKHLLYIFYVGALSACAAPEKYPEVRQITLDTGWVFRPGDDPAGARYITGGTGWHPIRPASGWQQQGFPAAGFAWYQNRFFLSSSLRESASDSLVFHLGVIKDSDQVFLNGKLLGENGHAATEEAGVDSSFTVTGSSATRRYAVSKSDGRLAWNRENLLAIRVFEKGTRGGAGMTAGIPAIRETSRFDSLRIDNGFYRYNQRTGTADTALTMVNTSSGVFRGDLELDAVAGAGKRLLHQAVTVSLSPGDTLRVPVSLPETMDPTTVWLTIRDQEAKLLKRDSLVIPFILFR